MKPVQKNRSNYTFFKDYQTRWRDNDVYGHMNNAVFYEFVDTTINYWLNTSGALLVPNSRIVGLVAHTRCDYFSGMGFPRPVTCGLKLERSGKTSVTYDVGLFRGDEEVSSAQAIFVHVYVDAITRKPVELPTSLKKALASIAIP